MKAIIFIEAELDDDQFLAIDDAIDRNAPVHLDISDEPVAVQGIVVGARNGPLRARV